MHGCNNWIPVCITRILLYHDYLPPPPTPAPTPFPAQHLTCAPPQVCQVSVNGTSVSESCVCPANQPTCSRPERKASNWFFSPLWHLFVAIAVGALPFTIALLFFFRIRKTMVRNRQRNAGVCVHVCMGV